MLCLGATKCGAMAAEAVIFFGAEAEKRAWEYELRRKRGGQVKDRAYADEYLDYDEDPVPPRPTPERDVQASQSGASPMGFTGAIAGEQSAPAGITELSGDTFGAGPTNPMLPGSWSPENPPEGGRPR